MSATDGPHSTPAGVTTGDGPRRGPEVPALALVDLAVSFEGRSSRVVAVDGVSLEVFRGETLGIVGESGAGKSVSVLAALGLLPPSAKIGGGTAHLFGEDLLAMSRAELRRVRGRVVGSVFQDPLSSLHPSFRIGDQIVEAIRVHDSAITRAAARKRAVELIDLVGVPAARRRIEEYPHQWSGGMRQRASIAMAIANGPGLLIADEPTTALDVTIQAQVLDVLRDAQRETGAATVLITHDLGVIAEMADRVVVMQRGHVVETSDVYRMFAAPSHPYTRSLLTRRIAPPDAEAAPSAVTSPSVPAVLDAVGLRRTFASDRGTPDVRAVDDVTFSLHAGETLGLVGESGCGKSTLARMLVGLLDPTEGRVVFEGRDLASLSTRELRRVRAGLRIVFQDPFSSLNPRRTVEDIVAEPLRIHRLLSRAQRGDRVRDLLDRVGLDTSLARRLPAQLSGGQRQRVGIARALSLEPKVLVLDEPVSSLDQAVRGQVLELLGQLQVDLGLAYLFVSHDLTVVRALCQRVAVMYLGRIVEIGPTEVVCATPAHPYTRALLSAVPVADPTDRERRQRIVLHGDLPDPRQSPSGCHFHPRCPVATATCAEVDPLLELAPDGRSRACHHPVDGLGNDDARPGQHAP